MHKNNHKQSEIRAYWIVLAVLIYILLNLTWIVLT